MWAQGIMPWRFASPNFIEIEFQGTQKQVAILGHIQLETNNLAQLFEDLTEILTPLKQR